MEVLRSNYTTIFRLGSAAEGGRETRSSNIDYSV